MKYITTRKIKVVGCLNCPYHARTEKVINEKTKEKGMVEYCMHHSFECAMPMDNEHIEDMKSGKKPMIGTQYFPDWCPLEMESVVCCCNPVN